MVEIRYGEQYEVTDLAGQTVSEAREHFKSEFGIPDKATAKLNGGKVKSSAELDTVLNDDDRLTFAVSRGKGAYLIGALLLALACTGGVFAFGFVNATTSLDVTAISNNFADVSVHAEASSITWTGYGHFKGTISGPYGLFTVDPDDSYTGDLVVSVTIGNADELVGVYRLLALKLEMINTSDNATIDINEDNTANSTTDWVMLTLNNGEVSMFPDGTTDSMAVRVKSGFYISHVIPHGGFTGGHEDPDLFCEVAQR